MRRLLAPLLLALPLAADEPVQGLKVHEWGVFVGSAAAGGGAPLDFIRKVGLPPDPKEKCCREPVIHVYAPRPLKLKVEVLFPSGRPTVAWPTPVADWILRPELERRNIGREGERCPCLSWELEAGGEAGPEPPKVPQEHWIAAARKVGASRLRTADGEATEDFLFYEGTLDPFPDLVRLAAATEAECLLDSKAPQEAWYILSDGKELRAAHGTGLGMNKNSQDPVRPIEPAALKADLGRALTAAGLTEKEAEVLLGIWMQDLVKVGKRLVYLLPRAEYDRILPIRFTPQPEELARVGLVLKEIGS